MRRQLLRCQRWSSRGARKVPCGGQRQPRTVERWFNDLIPLLVISNTDHVINTRDENVPIWCDQLPQEGDKVSHGFVHGSAKDTGVEVASRTGDFNEHVCQATEAVGDARSTGVEPVVIGLKVDSVKGLGLSKEPRLTMQTASTPWNQPSFPLACSAAMNSSRPRLPLSSMPSKTNRIFTGSSSPKFLWASRTFNHPRMGPLSSEDPRPMS
jgi:hypothetical protein